MIVGCRNKTDLRGLQKFIKALQILPVTDEISDRASELLILYNLSHNLLIPDSLIAATALIHDEEFVTKNQCDFRFIGGLRLLKY
jgi:predicted nucleic acid-binding protein